MSILNFLKKINNRIQDVVDQEWANRHDLSHDDIADESSEFLSLGDELPQEDATIIPWSLGEAISADGLHNIGGLTWSGDDD
ncbi:hypothetical protein [Geothermobacter hydrogeniphilus]|uniref:Uncharacterized protein n=1 Tax=Geothermobacter hydrogeniphilus TaxID=1969733 RepID=A0A1X0XX79_9BACT|nr:hypothetical protein [Geothermobacter hydrogeniphilus]ORJ57511.1 hypothetical protein B5V00_13760 [Geothermobacter hydrogeniphilus]